MGPCRRYQLELLSQLSILAGGCRDLFSPEVLRTQDKECLPKARMTISDAKTIILLILVVNEQLSELGTLRVVSTARCLFWGPVHQPDAKLGSLAGIASLFVCEFSSEPWWCEQVGLQTRCSVPKLGHNLYAGAPNSPR